MPGTETGVCRVDPPSRGRNRLTRTTDNRMPTYEYLCKACGHRFDRFQKISDSPVRTCPSCGKRRVERLISSGGGLVFKGSGFYATDYRKDGPPADRSGDAGGEGGGTKSGADSGSPDGSTAKKAGESPAGGDGGEKGGSA